MSMNSHELIVNGLSTQERLIAAELEGEVLREALTVMSATASRVITKSLADTDDQAAINLLKNAHRALVKLQWINREEGEPICHWCGKPRSAGHSTVPKCFLQDVLELIEARIEA